MPRGRKKMKSLSPEEQLQSIEDQIASHKKAIASLKVQRKAVLEAKEKAELTDLMDAIRMSGKTPAEFLTSIQKQTSFREKAEQSQYEEEEAPQPICQNAGF